MIRFKAAERNAPGQAMLSAEGGRKGRHGDMITVAIIVDSGL